MMKKSLVIIGCILTSLLVVVGTLATTYAVYIDVTSKDGINEVVNRVTARDLLTRDNGEYNDTYYVVEDEIGASSEEMDVLMDSTSINNNLQGVIKSVVNYRLEKGDRISNDKLYELIWDGVNNTDIDTELRARIISKSRTYIEDISDFLYSTPVRVIEGEK